MQAGRKRARCEHRLLLGGAEAVFRQEFADHGIDVSALLASEAAVFAAGDGHQLIGDAGFGECIGEADGVNGLRFVGGEALGEELRGLFLRA